MLSALNFKLWTLNISCAFIPLATIDTVFHCTSNLLACCIATIEGKRRQLVFANLFRDVAGQRGGFVAQRQTEGSAMRLATHIGNISLHHEMIEHRTKTQVLWHQHGHIHHKGTIVCCRGLAFIHHLTVHTASQITLSPIAGVGHPPKSHLATNGIFHLSALHRNTCIG